VKVVVGGLKLVHGGAPRRVCLLLEQHACRETLPNLTSPARVQIQVVDPVVFRCVTRRGPLSSR
jgi:hypothetical protein